MNTIRIARFSPWLLLLALPCCRVEKKEVTIPSFSLAWSEYPSWSTFGVADELGLVDADAGKQGEIEKRWDVDIVLRLLDYGSCLQGYGSGSVDAVCITNTDVLNPCLGKKGVAIVPTSTSKGADACIVVGIASPQELVGKKVYGLEKSVSEYCFVRNLEIAGIDPTKVSFSNREPDAAALAMQQGDADCKAIMVWNPFVLSTLEVRKDAKVLFDSTQIPGEIVDMLVVADAALAKPGGDRFACALADVFYTVSRRIDDPATRDETLVALGAKFSSLGLEAMKKVVEQTDFYETPALGIELFRSQGLPKVMDLVMDFSIKHDILESPVTIGYGTTRDAALTFDASFMERVAQKQ